MTYRDLDETANQERTALAEKNAAEEARFVKAARKDPLRIQPRRMGEYLLLVVGLPAGCIAGDAYSDAVGTVGDMAGGFEWLFRCFFGGCVGLLVAILVFRQLRKRRLGR